MDSACVLHNEIFFYSNSNCGWQCFCYANQFIALDSNLWPGTLKTLNLVNILDSKLGFICKVKKINQQRLVMTHVEKGKPSFFHSSLFLFSFMPFCVFYFSSSNPNANIFLIIFSCFRLAIYFVYLGQNSSFSCKSPPGTDGVLFFLGSDWLFA